MLGRVAGRGPIGLRPLEAGTLHQDGAMAGSPQAGNRPASPACGPSLSSITFWTQPRITNGPTLPPPPLTPRRYRLFAVAQERLSIAKIERRRALAERAGEPMKLSPDCGKSGQKRYKLRSRQLGVALALRPRGLGIRVTGTGSGSGTVPCPFRPRPVFLASLLRCSA